MRLVEDRAMPAEDPLLGGAGSELEFDVGSAVEAFAPLRRASECDAQVIQSRRASALKEAFVPPAHRLQRITEILDEASTPLLTLSEKAQILTDRLHVVRRRGPVLLRVHVRSFARGFSSRCSGSTTGTSTATGRPCRVSKNCSRR